MRDDPRMAERMARHRQDLRLEQQVIDAMQRQHVTAAELARRVSCQPSAISRDLKGGLSKAKLGRVEQLANAIEHDFIAFVIPRDPAERRRTVDRIAKELIADLAS
ncbi:MAG TPA: hypothetical protein VK669_01390 [Candidatus Limnocylindrales bacterium]|nr:hypothetical protein [Candidatus Limnocylindrales bacterium]